MNEIESYRVSPNGSLRVKPRKGRERDATASEWLALWRSDPRLTLQLVH